jgi:hypothetical protein
MRGSLLLGLDVQFGYLVVLRRLELLLDGLLRQLLCGLKQHAEFLSAGSDRLFSVTALELDHLGPAQLSWHSGVILLFEDLQGKVHCCGCDHALLVLCKSIIE